MLELNVVSGELSWHGKLLARMSPSETLLLEHFITHSELLISKDNLLDVGWPQTIVAPNTLVVAINNIRKHVSKTRVSIETIHRRGYIFHSGECIVQVIKAKSNLVNAETNMSPLKISGQHNHEHIKIVDSAKTNSTIEAESLESFKKILRVLLFPLFSLFRRGAFYILFAVSVISSLTVHNLKNEWFCYKLENANICGIFKLSDFQLSTIRTGINDSHGDFLYGFENDLAEIKVYKVY